MLKRNGERWSPWGTPDETSIGVEIKFLNFTNCIRWCKKDLYHDKRGSAKPIWKVYELTTHGLLYQKLSRNLYKLHLLVDCLKMNLIYGT